jgi:hypothetical protein
VKCTLPFQQPLPGTWHDKHRGHGVANHWVNFRVLADSVKMGYNWAGLATGVAHARVKTDDSAIALAPFAGSAGAVLGLMRSAAPAGPK